MKRTLGALILLCLMVPIATQAQGTAQIKPGDRVRVTAPECQLQKQKAALVSVENGILTAISGDETFECPVEALTRLDVLVGERGGRKLAWIGALVGAVGGAIMSPACEENAGSCLLALPVAGGAVGFLVGSAVGLIIGEEIWEEVGLPPIRPSFDVSAHGRFGFGLSIRWRR